MTVTITGTDFVAGATASFGTGVSVWNQTVLDSTHFRVTIQASQSAPTGARTITVTNADGGRGTCVGCFTVDPSG
jgi:hypothetical protein